MASRRVSVFLELIASQYLAETNKLIVKTGVADRAIDDLGDEVRQLDRGLATATATAGAAARAIDDIGDEARASAVGVGLLSHELATAKRKLLELRAAHMLPGGGTVESGNAILAAEREVARLQRLVRAVTPGPGGGGVGGWFGSGVDFSRGLSETRGILIGGLVLAIAEALPAIGAMVAGAVTGAVGAGGVIGGVVAAAQDPRVKHAFTDAISGFTAEDFGATAFVKPTIGAIKELEAALHRVDFAKVLAPAAKYVEPLAKGLGGFVERFGPRLEQTLKNAAPFIAVMEKSLPEVGDALGQMFEQMSQGKGAVEGLAFLFGVINGTLRGVGQTVHWLSDRFYDLTTTATFVYGMLAKIPGPMQGLFKQTYQDFVDFRNQTNEAEQGTQGFGGTLNRLATGSVHLLTGAVDAYNAQLEEMIQNTRDWLDLTMDQDRQAIKWQEDLDALAESVHRNGRGLDLYSEKGRANRSAILDLIEDARQQFEINQRLGMSFQENTRLLEQQTERIKWHAYHLGLDKKAVDALVNRYIIEIQVRTYVFGPLANYINQIFGKGLKIGGFQLFGAAHVAPGDFSGGSTSAAGLQGFASGGYPPIGVPVTVGEHGPEVAVFGQAARVYPNSQTWNGGGGYAMPAVDLNVYLLDSPSGRISRSVSIADALSRNQSQSQVAAANP